MTFHRLTVPTYTGGLRGGEDYLNNAVSGTPTPTDGAIGGGTYAGSYFFGFGEQLISAALNRGLKALGENTDALDDRVTALEAGGYVIPALDIDWGKSNIFTKDLAVGVNAFTFSNVTSKAITVRLLADPGGSSVDWSTAVPAIKWPGGTVPTQSPTGMDVYTFIYDGTYMLGAFLQNYS